MLTVEQIEVIRRAYYCEHKSVRAIARELGHGRRVIREAIAGTSPSPRQYKLREAKPRPVIGPVAPIIDGWLEQDRAAPRKQRHTAKRHPLRGYPTTGWYRRLASKGLSGRCGSTCEPGSERTRVR